MSARAVDVPRGPRSPALDRLLSIRIGLTWEVAVYAAIVAAAIALRFWDLGSQSLHHDESIHAQWSWGLLQGNYRHDPIFHGPLYYHAQGLVFFLFGPSDYTARVSAAIFGSALVLLPLLLRRRLGFVGTVAAVAFIAFSPTIVYYSRFFREDIYMAFFTMLMVASMWRYFAEPKDRWLIVFALAFAGSMATKEATYISVAIFLVFLDVYLAALLATQTLETRGTNVLWRRVLLTAALTPWAWAAAALWPLLGALRRNFDWDHLPRPGGMLVLLGTLTFPLLTPLLRSPLETLGLVEEQRLVCRCFWDESQGSMNCRGSQPGRDAAAMGGLFLVTASASALIGIQWRTKVWLIAAGAAAILYLTLMTSFWTNLQGLCTGPWGSLDYWLSQHDVRRGGQPWFYYYMLMPAYEFLPLVIAIGGIWWSTVRGDAFSRFLWLWLIGTWLALSLAGEKMPWLNTHIALPAAILAAWTIGRAWRSWRSGPPPGRLIPALLLTALASMAAMLLIAFLPGGNAYHALRLLLVLGVAALVAFILVVPFGRRALGIAAVAVVVGALGVFSVRTMLMVTFERRDVPKDMLIYTQSSPDIREIAAQIDALADATGMGLDLPIAVDTTDSFAWPWAWYLRDYRSVNYVNFSSGMPDGDYQVLLVARENLSRVSDSLGAAGDDRFGTPIRYPHRWWFEESGYRSAIPSGPWQGTTSVGPLELPKPIPEWDTWQGIARGTFGGDWLETIFLYWRDHDPGRPPGSVDAYVLFPAAFDPETGLLSAGPVAPPAPTTDSAGRPMFGGLGIRPGQFFSPVDIEADAEGNIYVIDSTSKRLQKFDSEGNFLGYVDVRGTGGTSEASDPWGLGIAPTGEVVVADTFGWKVRIFNSDLSPTGVTFGTGQATAGGPFDLYGPRDAAIDRDGLLWITDTGNHRLMVYTLEGEFVRQVGEPGAGPLQFSEPVGIDVAPDGVIAIADMYNGRVQLLDPAGAYRGEFAVPGWGGRLAVDKPYITALRDGNIALSLPSLNEVRVYGRDGTLLHTITGDDEPLDSPYGILESADGNLWVVEGGSARIRLFTLK